MFKRELIQELEIEIETTSDQLAQVVFAAKGFDTNALTMAFQNQMLEMQQTIPQLTNQSNLVSLPKGRLSNGTNGKVPHPQNCEVHRNEG